MVRRRLAVSHDASLAESAFAEKFDSSVIVGILDRLRENFSNRFRLQPGKSGREFRDLTATGCGGFSGIEIHVPGREKAAREILGQRKVEFYGDGLSVLR